MKFPKTRREVFKLTHFIRIPLLNQTSSTQIQEALFKVARDPVSAAVPSLAYKPFQRMSVSIAALNLPTQESREQAIALLQSLGRREWREVLLKAQAACSVATSSSPSSENLKNENISQQEPQPLVVDLIGIGDSTYQRIPRDLKSALALLTFIKDPAGLLAPFCKALALEFRDAGLWRNDPLVRDPHFRFDQTKIVDTRLLRSEIPNSKPSLRRYKLFQCPRFDARDLCEKFKDLVLAKNVHLDRVCISEIGAEDIFEEGQRIGMRHRDIISIPLPGVTWEPRPFERMEIPHRWNTAENPERRQS